MSSVEQFTEDDQWIPPEAFREACATAERLSAQLLGDLQGQLLVPVADIEFLVRRLYRVTRDIHVTLPPEVG